MIEITQLVAQAANEEVQLTTGGGIIMVLSVSLVCVLCTFCIQRVLRDEEKNKQ